MASIVSVFIGRSYQRMLAAALWLATFLVIAVAGAVFFVSELNQQMQAEARRALDPQVRLRQNLEAAWDAMDRSVTAAPCSADFHTQLRAVAYLPDGLNEFLYAPSGIAMCSVAADFPAFVLGEPDATDATTGISVWYDRALDFAGQVGLTGTIMLRGDWGIVLPPSLVPNQPEAWLELEVVTREGGLTRHRVGRPGIYDDAMAAGPLGGYLPLRDGAFFTLSCADAGTLCTAATAPLQRVLVDRLGYLMLGLVVAAILAMGISMKIHGWLRHFWSFEARFLRNFNYRSIVCTYQPIMALATSSISGCEVLVRWRDVDGAIVFPDKFLPVVEKHGLGRRLTEYVVQRAVAELRAQVPASTCLQVNFNVFPRDLDAIWLRDILDGLLRSEGRFTPVVEIVESDEVQIAKAQREIAALRRSGIRTHLDDFGTGYSNIQNLAVLDIGGVKLDRSFAMAAEGSLMARMLGNAIEMIHAAGHKISIEGVETPERLHMLQQTGQVDFVQGYLISRPLEIGAFAAFLGEHATPAGVRLKPRLVA